MVKLSFVQDTFFLYRNSNLVKKKTIAELREHIAIFGAISYFGKKKSSNNIDLITPENKLNFSSTQKAYKEEIVLQLAKVCGKFFFTASNKIRHFGILTTKKEKKRWPEKINV